MVPVSFRATWFFRSFERLKKKTETVYTKLKVESTGGRWTLNVKNENLELTFWRLALESLSGLDFPPLDAITKSGLDFPPLDAMSNASMQNLPRNRQKGRRRWLLTAECKLSHSTKLGFPLQRNKTHASLGSVTKNMTVKTWGFQISKTLQTNLGEKSYLESKGNDVGLSQISSLHSY